MGGNNFLVSTKSLQGAFVIYPILLHQLQLCTRNKQEAQLDDSIFNMLW